MAKHKKKHHYGGWILALLMILYAVVFLAAAAYGLEYVWDIMETYEASRTHVAIDGYMEKLDANYVCDRSQALIDQVDPLVQSPEESRQVILDFLKGGISYAKKASECTDTHQVYVLRSGGKVIGRFEMEAQGEEKYGLVPWQVTGDSFDLSFLLTDTVSTVAPHDYGVYVNGKLLTQAHVTETNIRYEGLSDFYNKNYPLPYQVRYQAGPCLGEISLEVRDPAGNSITIDKDTDMTPFIDLQAQPQRQELDSFAKDFVHHYVWFMGNYKDNLMYNYNNVLKFVVPGSSLETRLDKSLDGLQWIAHATVTMEQLDVNLCIPMADGRYLMDVTYAATMTQPTRADEHTGDNLKLVVVKTDEGWKVETMYSY